MWRLYRAGVALLGLGMFAVNNAIDLGIIGRPAPGQPGNIVTRGLPSPHGTRVFANLIDSICKCDDSRYRCQFLASVQLRNDVMNCMYMMLPQTKGKKYSSV